MTRLSRSLRGKSTTEYRGPRQQRLTLHVPPSANNWHRTVKGRILVSAEARMYPKSVALSALMQRIQVVPSPHDIRVDIVWWRARKSGDVDKRGAILLDALQGVAFDDDKQIRSYSIERDDSEPDNPRVEVTITVLGDVEALSSPPPVSRPSTGERNNA